MNNSKVIIQPQSNFLNIDFQELWRFRELLYIFVWRDIKVRYKQTFLGIAWAIFQPLVTMVIFTFFFGKLAGLPSGNLPYMVFVYIGLIIWNFFSNSLSSASGSLVEHEQMIKKIYFPRLLIPLASVITSSIDFLITLIILVVLLIYFQILPSPLLLLYTPLLFLITFFTASGLGLFMSSVNVKYRDVRYILPFFIQILMFLSPVIYPSTIIASQHKWILNINPLTFVIETSRSLISGIPQINFASLLSSLLISILIFLTGLFYLRKTERFFADIV